MNIRKNYSRISADNSLDEKKISLGFMILPKLLYNHMQDSTTPTNFFSLREKVYSKKTVIYR
mgnify:CR=1 FL=1